MAEIKCGVCGRYLAKGEVVSLEIKCPRCKTLNHVRVENPDQSPQGRHEEFSNASRGL
ncbi:MAG: Com family DNA-binding transcriptional regulator [Desulfovibrio sp.]|nr:Com family DNA-binding transcriptional regulator [Desulfovibrio sp.]MBI4960430.1 Com family DNA-binding transcriptional regulator [Desulfovibrio sp.]